MRHGFRTSKTRPRRTQLPSQRRARRTVVEELEPRLVLAPVIDPDLDEVFSIRLVTPAVTGRIEIAPLSFAGGDTFVIEREGPTLDRPTAPAPGTISRVNANGQVRFFASVPAGGDLGFGGYKNFFDLVVDPIGIFDGIPSIFVSTSDQVEAAKNAIYRFDASGTLLGGGPFATFTQDSDFDLTFDDHPTVLAISPIGSPFGPGLFVADVERETPTEGDDLFIFRPGYVPGGIIGAGLLPAGVTRLADIADRIGTAGLPDVDIRGMVFDSNGLYEDRLIFASTDLEDGTEATTGRLDAPSAQRGSTFPTTLAEPLDVHRWTDSAFDPVGFFSIDEDGNYIGSYFGADNAGGGVPSNLGVLHRIGPAGNFNTGGDADPFAFNFNVGITDLAIDPIGGLDRAFSLSFSPDGLRLQVADLDGIWEIHSDFGLPCSDAGVVTGVCDVLVNLGRPYRGAGTAIAVMDTGVDPSHPGFAGLVTAGVDIALGLPTAGNLDEFGHGTAVAGIIHQIVPDAVIVPIKFDIAGTGGFTNRQIVWEGIKYVADNPVVVHPLTGALVPLITANMSFGLINSQEIFDSELEGADIDPTSLFTYKDQFQRWAALQIYPVASAGNEGLIDAPSGPALDGMGLPAIINEVISVAASYPYGPTPPLTAPGGCTLEVGDFIAYPDKVTAFSSRSQDTDFLAPGTCVRTFNPLHLAGEPTGNPPIEPAFNGTSAAAPMLTGIYGLVHSALRFWVSAAAAGSSNANFLTGTSGGTVPLPGITSLAGYFTPNGINAILQWTAHPHEDVDFDPFPGAGIEDEVAQQHRLEIINGSLAAGRDYRVYSRIDVAQAVAAIEGKIASDYFLANPSFVTAMDANRDSTITVVEIQTFADAPGGNATAKAMARLLGGTASDALRRRTDFFDRLDGPNPLLAPKGIHVTQFSTLAATLLPSLGNPRNPSDDPFIITQRVENAARGYLEDPAAVRNWRDMLLMLPAANFVDGVPDAYRGKGPSDFGGAVATTLVKVFPTYDPDGDGQQGVTLPTEPPMGGQTHPPTLGGSIPPGSDGDTSGGSAPLPGAGTFAALFRNGMWFIDAAGNGGAAERSVAFGIPGDVPVIGDWDSSGVDDLGIFRGGMWFFDENLTGGRAERAFAFGVPGDIPLAGDFDGNGTADVAVFRGGVWFFDLDGRGRAAERARTFGLPGDRPVVGDWNGDGVTDIAVFRAGMWFFDLNNAGGAAEKAFAFGIPSDVPVAGDWNNSGPTDVAVFRNGMWFFDTDGRGGAAERAFAFGVPGDVPRAFRVRSQQGEVLSPSGGDPLAPPIPSGSSSSLFSSSPKMEEMGPPMPTTSSGSSGDGSTLLSSAHPVVSSSSGVSGGSGDEEVVDRALDSLLEEGLSEDSLLAGL